MEIILFFVIFITVVIVGCISINKIENSLSKELPTQREKLELENTEFDYGHNIRYDSKEEEQ